MDELSELLTTASSGDENALKTLNLDKPVKLALDKPYVNVGIIRLTGEYETTRALIAAADRLKLWTLAASCRNKLKYLQFIAKEFCKTTLANKPLPGETVADVMKDLLEEIEVRRQQIEGEKKAAESDSETEMVSRKSDEKKGEESERKEGQSVSSVKDADKEIEVEYGKEPRSLEKKNSVNSVRPNKEEPKLPFHPNNGLKEILNRNDGDLERCYNKVKYIFKKRGANK